MRPIPHEKADNRKTPIIVSTCIIAFVVISLIAALFHRSPTAPDPAEMTKLSAIKYMATKEFAALPDSEKELYFEKIAPQPGKGPPPGMEQLTDDERKALHRNMRKVMHAHMKKRLQKFFSSSKEEQDQMLDDMIAERKEHEKNRASDGAPPPGEDPAKQMKDMLENTDSTTRAQMHEMHERMKARETGK